MPTRLLKESICTSDEIDKLTAFQEVVFYRLIVNCDDYGRLDARPAFLASRLFPLRRSSIRENQIEDALRALTSADLVIVYHVNGKPILQMKTWDRHQQIRAKRPKYDGPEKADADCNENKSSDNTCKQMISDDNNGNQVQTNVPVIQSNPNPNPNTNPNPNLNPSLSKDRENGNTSRAHEDNSPEKPDISEESREAVAVFRSFLEREYKKIPKGDRKQKQEYYQHALELCNNYVIYREKYDPLDKEKAEDLVGWFDSIYFGDLDAWLFPMKVAAGQEVERK